MTKEPISLIWRRIAGPIEEVLLCRCVDSVRLVVQKLFFNLMKPLFYIQKVIANKIRAFYIEFEVLLAIK
jgi:hypothetical protein